MPSEPGSVHTAELAPEQRRRFIRHTAGVPLEVRTLAGAEAPVRKGINVSTGGLSFVSECELEVGSTIEVRIGEVDPPFEAQARVAWIRPEGEAFCVGVQFIDDNDAFRARMVEQVCSIENYQREVETNEGRVLTREQAAHEWITRFAHRFPDPR
jgi:hypothetical protein